MRNTLFFIPIFLGFLAFSPAFAATVKTGEHVYIQSGNVVHDNLYIAGGDVMTAEAVFGDIVAAGGNLKIIGNVSGDVLLFGGNITLLGSVDGDVRVFGGNVTIAGTVSGDLVAFGGSVSVLPGATIGKDVISGGGLVSLDGTINGNVKVAGGAVTLSGIVKEDVFARPGERLTLSPNARIDGKLTYTTNPKLSVSADNGQVKGGIVAQQGTHYPSQAMTIGLIAKTLSVIVVIKFIVFFLSSLVFILLFRKFAQHISEKALSFPGQPFFIGFALLVTVPIAAMFLCMTVVGSMFGGILFFFYGALLMIASLCANIVAGAWVQKALERKSEIVIDWKTALLGTAVIFILALIPILGWAVASYVFLVALGVVGRSAYQKFWINR